MKKINIQESTEKLIQFIEKEKFKGYDPYDLLNSAIPFHYFGRMVQAIVVQVGKLMPFNLRPFLFIKKEQNPKGLGLLLSAYCILYKNTKKKKYLDIAGQLYDTLKKCRSNGYDEYCWGYNFVWANPNDIHPKYMPSSVVTSFVCQGIFEYYKICGSEEAAKIIISASEYILKYLKQTKTDHGICISYTEEKQNCCYNASLLSGELLSMHYAISKNDNLRNLIKKIVSFVLAHQHNDGHWNYSIDLPSNKERQQIDFHQGFVLCSLYRICQNLNEFPFEVENALTKGLQYYCFNQFSENGRSLWRVPKLFPVDIHNQAQGIITFCLLSEKDEKKKEFAQKIAQWTIKHMQSSKGYFYYRIYRFYTIRTPFMRWSQAWMLLAYSYLLNDEKKQ